MKANDPNQAVGYKTLIDENGRLVEKPLLLGELDELYQECKKDFENEDH